MGNVQIEQNTIAFNMGAGVSVTDSINRTRGDSSPPATSSPSNSIFSNGGPGIGTSSYLNDSPDEDGIQNYPTINSVMPLGHRHAGQGDDREQAKFELPAGVLRRRHARGAEYYMPGEVRQGRTYLGTIDVTTDGNGMANFTVDLPSLPAGQPYVTATATDITDDGSRAAQQHLAVLGRSRSWAGRASLSRTPMTPGWGACARRSSTPTTRRARRRSLSPSRPPTPATSITATTASQAG